MTDCISRLSEGISNFLLFQPPYSPGRLSQLIIPLCKTETNGTITYNKHNQPRKVLYSFYLLCLLNALINLMPQAVCRIHLIHYLLSQNRTVQIENCLVCGKMPRPAHWPLLSFQGYTLPYPSLCSRAREIHLQEHNTHPGVWRALNQL